MRKLLIVCFLLGINTTTQQLQALSEDEHSTLTKLCEKEYNIKVDRMSVAELSLVKRDLRKIRIDNYRD